MLDAHIIDAIRRERESRERAAEEGRRLELELPVPLFPPDADGRAPADPGECDEHGFTFEIGTADARRV